VHRITSRRSNWHGLALGRTSMQAGATGDNFRQSQHSEGQPDLSTQDKGISSAGRISATGLVVIRVRVQLRGAA
jgi:hypothetical protein